MKNVISTVAGIAIVVSLIMATLLPIANRGVNTANNTMTLMNELENKINDFEGAE